MAEDTGGSGGKGIVRSIGQTYTITITKDVFISGSPEMGGTSVQAEIAKFPADKYTLKEILEASKLDGGSSEIREVMEGR